ncbi:MAG: hypothetical protein P9E88_05325 [Candidatus Competibacter sp.]|nr:hypothetical protein [Candidatus Competibacter sp.]
MLTTMAMPMRRCLMNLSNMLGLMVTKPTVTILAPVRKRDSMAQITRKGAPRAVSSHFVAVQDVF